LKNLLLISTGGTISQEKDAHGIAHPVESKGAEALSTKLTEIAHSFNIEIVPRGILNKDSSNITPGDWDLIISTIVTEYEDYDVFLITHGTNTLGYTCAALSFALGRLGKPVIVTGSQVSYGYPGSDAMMNLENAWAAG
jgi:L-asparaginase